MTLERALEVALKELEGDTWPERHEAAAVLRAFMEKGLPFYRAAEKFCAATEVSDADFWRECMHDAYRAKGSK